jgi:hypothetical protein
VQEKSAAVFYFKLALKALWKFSKRNLSSSIPITVSQKEIIMNPQKVFLALFFGRE